MNKSFKNALRSLLPRTVKTHRILRGVLTGAYIVTSWFDYPGALLGRTEEALLKYFETNIKRGEFG